MRGQTVSTLCEDAGRALEGFAATGSKTLALLMPLRGISFYCARLGGFLWRGRTDQSEHKGFLIVL